MLEKKVLKHTLTPHMELRLEDNKTVIYIDNNRFYQCMYLLIQIPTEKTEETREFVNIDELSKKYSITMEHNHTIIPPEVEFWGHCSNLEAWVENDYNPNILHSNLARPLLKKLCLTDFKIFCALLKHLDCMFLEYESVERKKFLLDTYDDVIKEAIKKYNVSIFDTIKYSVFLKTVYLKPFFDKLCVTIKKCECCEEYYPFKSKFYTFDLFYSCYNEEPNLTVEVCEKCSEDYPYTEDYEYCEYCGRYIDNEYIVLHECMDDYICNKCYIDAIEGEGINEALECEIIGELLSEDDIIGFGFEKWFEFEKEERYEHYFEKWSEFNHFYVIGSKDVTYRFNWKKKVVFKTFIRKK